LGAPNRFLLIQSRWMGDVLLCTPAVRELRRAFPEAHLAFASEAPGVDALRGNPHLDELLVLGPGWNAALEITCGDPEREHAARLWEAHGLEGERVVALSPVSRTRHKQWGAHRWAAAGDALAESGVRLLLLSGPAERGQLQAVAERMHTPVICDGTAANVRQLAAIYQRCALWVGNDGGLRHVAAAARIPTVTVFRWRQTPFWSDPDPSAGQVALEEPPPGGCDLRCDSCPHLGCLGALTVERVVDAARAQLARAAETREAPPPRFQS
jgi:ADP-heptose:LPS heptosyltransferase